MIRKSLVAAALAAALSIPAQAHPGGPAIPSGDSPRFAAAPPSGGFVRCRDGGRHARGRNFVCNGFGDGFAYADGQWALYNNHSWDADSYNDWWNDRPDRAYPRWVQDQRARGTCDPDRMWWSGSGWHC